MFRKVLTTLAFLALAALPALAKPNFSGDWKLNTTKSTFGDIPAPDSMSYKVDHADPKISTVSKQSGQMGDIEMKSVCATDGKECTNEGFQGSPIKSVMKWDGDTLVNDAKGQFGDMDFSMNQKWTLSADGKTLTIVQTVSMSMGEFTQTLVFDKQ